MKTDYTKLFETFWRAYPRKTAKATAFKSWQKNVYEDDAFMAKAITDDLAKRTRLKWWPFDTTKIPHAATWLNQERYLDEGWEDDIKTRGQETKGAAYTPRDPYEELPGHGNGDWMSMLNRLMRNYLLKLGGVNDAMLKTLIKEKNLAHTEIFPVANEEIDAADNKPAMKSEMALLFAETMLNRFDMITGKSLKTQIIKISRKT